MLATRLVVLAVADLALAQRAIAVELVAVGRHFALGDRGAQAGGRIDQHPAFGGAGKPAAGRARRHQGLEQQAHRGVGRVEIVRRHVAQRPRRPQRGPAGAHRGEEIGLVVEPEKALELPGEARAVAVLHKRRGAHHAGKFPVPGHRPPGRQ
jgi:hypothetical protein